MEKTWTEQYLEAEERAEQRTLDMLTPEQARQAAQRTREIEEQAELRTEAMLDRLIEKRRQRLQAGIPTTTTLRSDSPRD